MAFENAGNFRPFDLGQTLSTAENINNARLQNSRLSNLLETQPQRLEQEGKINDLNLRRGEQELQGLVRRGSLEDMATDAVRAHSMLSSGDVEGARGLAMQRRQKLLQRQQTDPSVDTVQTDRFLSVLDQNPEAALKMLTADIDGFQRAGVLGRNSQKPTANIQDFQFYKNLSEADQRVFDNVMRGATVKDIGNVPHIVTSSGATPVSTLENEINAKVKETEAIKEKEEQIKSEALAEKTRKENEIAYGTFSTAMDNVSSSLSQTITGPILGRIPATTSSQQIADGALAAMAPILKQLFRSAGEGQFTDKDQELLMNMLPDRKDHPKAAQAKIKAINEIVAAKLGIEAPAESNQGMSDEEFQKRKEALGL